MITHNEVSNSLAGGTLIVGYLCCGGTSKLGRTMQVLKVILCLTSLVEIDLSHMPQLDVDVLMSAFCAKSSIASNRRKIDLRYAQS